MYKNLATQYLTDTLRSYLIKKCSFQSEQETLQQTEECLRFLYLSHLTKGAIPVCQKIDEIWHLLILQTKEYFELCENLPGKKYIHHSSDIYQQLSRDDNAKVEAKRQLEWLVSYVKNFGFLRFYFSRLMHMHVLLVALA